MFVGACTSNGYVARWKLPSFELATESVLEPNASYHSMDFVGLESEPHSNAVVVAG